MASGIKINPGKIGPVEIICDGVYTAEGIALSGEKIYFGLERLENTDKIKWGYYKNSTVTLINGEVADIRIGSLLDIAIRVNDMQELREFLKSTDRPIYWSSNEAKFEDLCNNLKKRKITLDSSKAKELLAIPHASNGMNINFQTHIVYVSKIPITGRISFNSQTIGFEGYVDKYSNLIMSVGTTISNIVENRGIFKNPLSVIEEGYAGIAMMAHSFTCMVIQKHWPEVSIFKVRPLKKMAEIFLRSIPKDQITVNGIRGDIYDKGFEHERDVEVPVTVLANFYCSK